MKIKTKFNVLIIGAGKIGAFFDNPKSNKILTHGHAFSCHKGFNLMGFIDSNKSQAIKAAKIWKANAYDNLEDAFGSGPIDIVCISASTESHRKLLKKVLEYPVKLVLMEKPIAKTLSESKEIINLYSESKVPIIVNYTRRFLPEFEKIQESIKKGYYGKFIAGTGYYGKGLLNNGSHMIDLLHFFLGNISGFKIINSCNDFSVNDPTITTSLSLSDNKTFILQGINSESVSLFEMDLIFERQRIRIIESGLRIEFSKIKNNKIFSSYKSMIKYSESETSLGNYMYHVADNIYRHLTIGETIKCNIIDGYKVSELCFKILKKSS